MVENVEHTPTRWIVNRGELLDPSEFTLDAETECEMVTAEEYDSLGQQLEEAVEAERDWLRRIVDADTSGSERVLATLAQAATARLAELRGR